METQESPSTRVYAGLLTHEARRLQQEAREALEQGHYNRATALISDAELLAEDVHQLVCDIERFEIGGLMMLAAYDVRDVAQPARLRSRMRMALPPRRVRVALGASLLIGLALGEY